MKKIVIICLCIVFLGAAAVAAVYDQSNFSSFGRLFQPAPDGHIVGKDNGPGHGTHHPGEDCGKCHRVGGRAEAYLFTMAGTLYKDRAGREVLKGGEIILEDRDGNVISMTSNEAGNFWTYSLRRERSLHRIDISRSRALHAALCAGRQGEPRPAGRSRRSKDMEVQDLGTQGKLVTAYGEHRRRRRRNGDDDPHELQHAPRGYCGLTGGPFRRQGSRHFPVIPPRA